MDEWIVAQPEEAFKTRADVVIVDVAFFPDYIDYEGILGKAFSSPAHMDAFASGAVVLLVTRASQEAVERISRLDGVVDPTTLAKGLRDLALDRQAVCLRRSKT